MGGRERGREREREREGGREREGERKGEREGEREGERGREGGREGEREGERGREEGREEEEKYGAIETVFISNCVNHNIVCMWSMFEYSLLVLVVWSQVMCAMFFVEHFDQLILEYSTPHWFVYV